MEWETTPGTDQRQQTTVPDRCGGDAVQGAELSVQVMSKVKRLLAKITDCNRNVSSGSQDLNCKSGDYKNVVRNCDMDGNAANDDSNTRHLVLLSSISNVRDTNSRLNDTSMRMNDTSMRMNDTSMRMNDTSMRMNDTSMRMNSESMRMNDTSMRNTEAITADFEHSYIATVADEHTPLSESANYSSQSPARVHSTLNPRSFLVMRSEKGLTREDRHLSSQIFDTDASNQTESSQRGSILHQFDTTDTAVVVSPSGRSIKRASEDKRVRVANLACIDSNLNIAFITDTERQPIYTTMPNSDIFNDNLMYDHKEPNSRSDPQQIEVDKSSDMPASKILKMFNTVQKQVIDKTSPSRHKQQRLTMTAHCLEDNYPSTDSVSNTLNKPSTTCSSFDSLAANIALISKSHIDDMITKTEMQSISSATNHEHLILHEGMEVDNGDEIKEIHFKNVISGALTPDTTNVCYIDDAKMTDNPASLSNSTATNLLLVGLPSSDFPRNKVTLLITSNNKRNRNGTITGGTEPVAAVTTNTSVLAKQSEAAYSNSLLRTDNAETNADYNTDISIMHHKADNTHIRVSTNKTFIPTSHTVNTTTQTANSNRYTIDATSQLINPTSQIVSRTSQLINPTSQIVSPTSQLISPTSQLSNPTSQLVSPTSELISPTSQLVSPTSQLINPTRLPANSTTLTVNPSGQSVSCTGETVNPNIKSNSGTKQMASSSHQTSSFVQATASSSHHTGSFIQATASSSHQTGSFIQTTASSSNQTGSFIQTTASSSHQTGSFIQTTASSSHQTGSFIQTTASSSHQTSSFIQTTPSSSHQTGSFIQTTAASSHHTDSFIQTTPSSSSLIPNPTKRTTQTNEQINNSTHLTFNSAHRISIPPNQAINSYTNATNSTTNITKSTNPTSDSTHLINYDLDTQNIASNSSHALIESATYNHFNNTTNHIVSTALSHQISKSTQQPMEFSVPYSMPTFTKAPLKLCKSHKMESSNSDSKLPHPLTPKPKSTATILPPSSSNRGVQNLAKLTCLSQKSNALSTISNGHVNSPRNSTTKTTLKTFGNKTDIPISKIRREDLNFETSAKLVKLSGENIGCVFQLVSEGKQEITFSELGGDQTDSLEEDNSMETSASPLAVDFRYTATSTTNSTAVNILNAVIMNSKPVSSPQKEESILAPQTQPMCSSPDDLDLMDDQAASSDISPVSVGAETSHTPALSLPTSSVDSSTANSRSAETTTSMTPTGASGATDSSGEVMGRRLRNRNQRKFLPEKTRHKRQTLQDMTRPLKQWLYKHRTNPYPSKHDKMELVGTSHMSLTQVSNWFANARRRLKNTVCGEDLTWAKRITEYNHCAEGNAELFSIPSSDEEQWDSEDEGKERQETDVHSESPICQSNTPSPSLPHTPFSESALGLQAPAQSLTASQNCTTRCSPALEDQHSNYHKYKHSILQRYLQDASQQALLPVADLLACRARHRHLSSSTGSHDFEYLSTSSVSSPSHETPHDSFDEFSEEFETIAIRRRVTDNPAVHQNDDMYWKEIGAALALTSLARSHISK